MALVGVSQAARLLTSYARSAPAAHSMPALRFSLSESCPARYDSQVRQSLAALRALRPDQSHSCAHRILQPNWNVPDLSLRQWLFRHWPPQSQGQDQSSYQVQSREGEELQPMVAFQPCSARCFLRAQAPTPLHPVCPSQCLNEIQRPHQST